MCGPALQKIFFIWPRINFLNFVKSFNKMHKNVACQKKKIGLSKIVIKQSIKIDSLEMSTVLLCF